MTPRSGLPRATSATASCCTAPVIVPTIVPGDSGGADRAEPCRALGDDAGHVGQRLDVVDECRRRERLVVGTGHLDIGGQATARRPRLRRSRRPRRRPDGTEARSWKRGSAVEHFEERGLLAVEVLARALDDRHLHFIAPARLRDLVDRCPQPRDLGREPRLGRHDHRRRTDRPRRDERSFEDGVGIGAQDRTVFERARLPFRGVHHHRGGHNRRRIASDGAPLLAGRKASATASTEPRRVDLVDEHSRRDLSGRLECCTPARRQVVGEGAEWLRRQDSVPTSTWLIRSRKERSRHRTRPPSST